MSGAKPHRPPVRYVGLAQLALLAAVAVPLLMWGGTEWGRCWILGGLAAVVPQAFFAWQVFRGCDVRPVRRIVARGYAGEIGKFLLAALAFALIFAKARPLAPGAVFAGYGAMLMVQLTGAWLLLRQPAPPDKS